MWVVLYLSSSPILICILQITEHHFIAGHVQLNPTIHIPYTTQHQWHHASDEGEI